MKRLSLLMMSAVLPVAGATVTLAPAHAESSTAVMRGSFVDYPHEHGNNARPPKRPHPHQRGGNTCGLPATDLCTDFTYVGLHWAQLPVSYYVNGNGGPAGAKAAVDAGFGNWQGETKSSDVAKIYDGDASSISYTDRGDTTAVGAVFDGQNTVSFADLSASCQNCVAVTTYWYSRVTGTMVEFDMTLNTAYQWSTNGASNTFDVQDVVTHEAGHTVGLGDLYGSQDAALTMYGYVAPGETAKDTLGAGDVLGVRNAYPAG